MIYRTIILPVVLFGCETWSLTLRKKHRQNVFEIRMLRRICGHKKDEVIGESGKLYLLTTNYNLGDQIENNEMGGVRIIYGDRRGR